MTTETGRRLLSLGEAAVYIDASPRQIQKMIARGELPRVAQGRRTKIDVRDLDAWIERSKEIE